MVLMMMSSLIPARVICTRSTSETAIAAAWAFMGRVAEAAERLDHHPDWSNSWNRVVIDLVSHDVGAVTGRDLALARAIEEAVEGPTAP